MFIIQYRKRKIINEKEKQLVALMSIMHGQESERGRIAKDLHDGLGGMLSGIKLNLSALNINNDKQNAPLFEKLIAQLDSSIIEMRRIAHNMMPEALLKFGLVEAVMDFCDGINESKVISMKFIHLNLTTSLEKPAEVNLYRIIQELSNNAIKHAEAQNILVQMSENNNVLTITVEDDGKGFNIDQLPAIEGKGLQNVQARVDYLQGFLNIESEVGKGTSVIIEIPR